MAEEMSASINMGSEPIGASGMNANPSCALASSNPGLLAVRNIL
jgi:hypothetical protein